MRRGRRADLRAAGNPDDARVREVAIRVEGCRAPVAVFRLAVERALGGGKDREKGAFLGGL